jgi:hypothetical protein
MSRTTTGNASTKVGLLGQIKRKATAGSLLRLRGQVAGAQRYDEEVDNLASLAERRGWGDDALEAEEAGRAQASQVHREQQGFAREFGSYGSYATRPSMPPGTKRG